MKQKIAWNKGLTKETSESVRKNTEAKIGKPRPDMINNKFALGSKPNKTSWKKNNIPWNKNTKYSKEFVIEHCIGMNPNSRGNRKRVTEEQKEQRQIQKFIRETVNENPKWMDLRSECLQCGKEIFYNFYHKERKFCSKKCNGEWHVGNEEINKKLSLSHFISMNKPEVKEKTKIARARQIVPIQDTSIEVMMQNELKERGIKFEKHKLVLPEIHFRCDLFLEPNIVVECDGDYWHHYPEGTEKDKLRTGLMQEKGLKVLRYWEHEIKSNTVGCVDEIEEILCSTNNKECYEEVN